MKPPHWWTPGPPILGKVDLGGPPVLGPVDRLLIAGRKRRPGIDCSRMRGPLPDFLAIVECTLVSGVPGSINTEGVLERGMS